MAKRNIALRVTYEGTNYCGWQVQPNGMSVQETLERALQKLTQEEIKVKAASRTDAGVHANYQVAVFSTESTIPTASFCGALAGELPSDIVVCSSVDVSGDFDPRRDSLGKHYRYLIHEAPTPSAQLVSRAWWRYGSLDAASMQTAANHLVGDHDFTSFCAVDDANNNKVRHIEAIHVQRQEFAQAWPLWSSSGAGSMIVIDVYGNGFLKHMVRNIVGTLLEVGEGKRKPGQITAILISKNRQLAGHCAPARGLYLMNISYSPDIFAQDKLVD